MIKNAKQNKRERALQGRLFKASIPSYKEVVIPDSVRMARAQEKRERQRLRKAMKTLSNLGD